MNRLPIVILSLVVPLAILQAAPTDKSIQQLLSQAQTEYLRGEVDAAKHDFETVQQSDPKNQVATNFLRRIQVEQSNSNGGGKILEKELAGIMLPKVEIKEATLDSTLDFLKKAVAKATDGKKTVNFVSQLSTDAANRPVTLSLTNVPFGEVLRYLGSVGGVRFSFEKYAIMVKPAGGETAAAGAPAEEAKPQ